MSHMLYPLPVNLVVLSGHLSRAPLERTLASGSVLWSFEVTVRDDTGAATAPVSWLDPPRPPRFTAGDAIVVLGAVRRRFFRTAAGTQSRTEVVAASIVAGEQRGQVRKLLGRAAGALAQVTDAA